MRYRSGRSRPDASSYVGVTCFIFRSLRRSPDSSLLYLLWYNAQMIDKEEKPLVWIGSCKKDLMALSTNVRKFFGHALDFAQRGDRHNAAKVLKGFGSAGILEVVEEKIYRVRLD